MLFTTIYVSILPIVIAATLSTIVVKLRVFNAWRAPIDGGKNAWDGKRIFGDNKTWLGVAGLVIFGALCMVLWGYACAHSQFLSDNNWFYRTSANTFGFNVAVGALLGLAYAVAELPNSFMKRRQGISAGKTVNGARGIPNMVIDHTDSILGCALVMLVLCPLSVGEFISLVLVGAMTHIFVNIVLVLVKVKKNI